MTDEKKAGEIMRPADMYPRVPAHASLKETLLKIKEQLPNGAAKAALVVDTAGRPFGFITLRGILKALEPPYSKVRDWPVPFFWTGLAAERCARSDRIGIGDYVEPLRAVSVQAADNLLKVVHAMRQTKHHVLPVMEGDELVGMIDAGALFDELCRMADDHR